MIYNLWKTAKQGTFVEEEFAEAPALEPKYKCYQKEVSGTVSLSANQSCYSVLSLFVVGLGGLFELVPTFLVKSNIPTIASVKPYTPLELQGRDIYYP